MNRHNKLGFPTDRVMRVMCIVIFAFLLIFGLLFSIFLVYSRATIPNQYKVYDTGMSLVEKERTVRLHKFHGIGMSVDATSGTFSSYRDEFGREWFKRNGKVCKLWNPEERR